MALSAETTSAQAWRSASESVKDSIDCETSAAVISIIPIEIMRLAYAEVKALR